MNGFVMSRKRWHYAGIANVNNVARSLCKEASGTVIHELPLGFRQCRICELVHGGSK